jgi:hypothetical protein
MIQENQERIEWGKTASAVSGQWQFDGRKHKYHYPKENTKSVGPNNEFNLEISTE